MAPAAIGFDFHRLQNNKNWRNQIQVFCERSCDSFRFDSNFHGYHGRSLIHFRMDIDWIESMQQVTFPLHIIRQIFIFPNSYYYSKE